MSYYQDDWSDYLPIIDYAQLILPYSSLGSLSPYEVQNSYLPRTSFNWTPLRPVPANATLQLSRERAKDIATRIEEALKKGKEAIERAQHKKECNINIYQPVPDFDIGDKV